MKAIKFFSMQSTYIFSEQSKKFFGLSFQCKVVGLNKIIQGKKKHTCTYTIANNFSVKERPDSIHELR